MKRLLPLLLLMVAGFAFGALFLGRQNASRQVRELEREQAALKADLAKLQATLDKARARRTTVSAPTVPAPSTPDISAAPESAARDPVALLNELAAWQVTPGQGRPVRQVLARLDELARLGPPALPAIRQFLATGADVAYDKPGNKGPRDVRSLTEALVPVSLRAGLFDVLRQMGGAEAETILLDTLNTTRRGLELAYLTEVLEEMTPGKHRDAALAATRSLLASGLNHEPFDRDYLFAILQKFNDATYVSNAQAQLVQTDGRLDRGALRYLQQTLGEQSIAIAAHAWQDARLAEPGSKEPLARLALAFVGGNSQQAVQLWHTAITDPSITPDQKSNLVEDLNEDGLVNRKTPTQEDLQVIANRYALTQAYLQQDYVLNDKVLHAAFREADKDLRKFLENASIIAASPSEKPLKPVKPGK
jgi:hypothetical protein